MNDQSTALSAHTQKLNTDIVVDGGGNQITGLNPINSQQYWHLAQIFHRGNANPTLKNSFEYMVIMAYGAELGFSAIMAVANCALINGKPSVFGKGLMSKITEHGYRIREVFDGVMYEGENYNRNFKVVATLIDKDDKEIATDEYSIGDAMRAGLWINDEDCEGNDKGAWKNRQKPWRKHPKRMMKWRARGFLIGDNLSHLLKGATIAEVIDDDGPTIAGNIGSTLGTAAGKIENMANAAIGADAENAEFVDLDEIIEGESVGHELNDADEDVVEAVIIEDPAAEEEPEIKTKPKAKQQQEKPAVKEAAETPIQSETEDKLETPVKKETVKSGAPKAKETIEKDDKPEDSLSPLKHILEIHKIDVPEFLEVIHKSEDFQYAYNNYYFNGQAESMIELRQRFAADMEAEWVLSLPTDQRHFYKKLVNSIITRNEEKEEAEARTKAAAATEKPDEIAEPISSKIAMTSDMKDWLDFLDNTAISANGILEQWAREKDLGWVTELSDVQLKLMEEHNKAAMDRFDNSDKK